MLPYAVYPGDVLLTRNLLEEDNTSPGYWNHAAIKIESGIVEAQQDPGRVIVSDWNEFFHRYPQILFLRPHDKYRQKMFKMAETLVGRTAYRKGASYRLFMRWHIDNCVTVIRKCCISATGHDPGWHTPDDIASSTFFKEIGEKKL